MLLPANIVGQEPHGIEPGTAGKVAQRGKPAPWTAAEQLPPRPMNLRAPDDCASDHPPEEPGGDGNSCVASHIALRAVSACAMVTPSAYSRSPPTGMPRAIRVTTIAWPASCR